MKMKLGIYVIILLLMTAGEHKSVEAGNERTSPRLVGMAGANGAVARGLDAAGINPALLSLPYRSNIEITLAPIGGRFGSNFMDYNMYVNYFTGVDDPVTGERIARHLTPHDKQDILDSFPGDAGRIYADARILWLGFSIRGSRMGGLAFTVSDRFSMNFTMPVDYVRMLFDGFSEFGSTYDFSGTDAQSWWLREYAVSYASPRLHIVDFLPWVSFGGSVKRVDGYAYFGTESYDGYISNKGIEDGFMLEGEMNMFTRRASADFIYDPDMYDFNPVGKPAGSGWGFDLGVAAGISRVVTVGLSATDIGWIRWTGNTYSSTGSARVEIDDIFSREQQDSLRNAYTGNEEAIEPFTTSLSGAIRLGAALQLTQKLIVAADYTQGLNNMPSNTTVPRVAAGVEWRPVSFFPLRSGIAVGGLNGFTWAFGFGINVVVFDLEVATENIGLLLYPAKSKQASITVGTRFRL